MVVRGPRAPSLAILSTLLVAVAAICRPASAAGPGCDAARPAIAHRAGGIAISPAPSGAPIPCATITGNSAESAVLSVAPSGTIFYAPVLQHGIPGALGDAALVARSRDLGDSWEARDPGLPAHFPLVPWMHVDPATARLWLATPLPSLCGANISWSDDEGEHWQTNPSVGCPGQGALKVLEGPAPRGGAQPVGYPHVVYYCANLQDGSPLSTLYCYKSLDGGVRFDFVGSFPDPIPPPPACGSTLREARAGVVGPDGVLYFPMNRCDSLGIAVSRDEGASWDILPVAVTEIEDLYVDSLAVDAQGNLYIVWLKPDGLPYLTVSRDRGQSWSTPLMVAAPGVQQVRRTAIAAAAAGHVVIAYPGSTDDGAHFDGYITESRNALDAEPMFWSASVNDPAHPLIDAADTESFGDRLFFGTAAIGPDGTPWAGFHCAKTDRCPNQRLGVAGRLAWPALACIPSVSGPIPITDESRPYRALALPPLAPDYIEEEFFLSCTAFGRDYRTLLNVRRPAQPARFSGNVVVDVTHPSSLWPLRMVTSAYQTRAGHVSAAVVSSPFALALAKGANPTRYASLDIPPIDGIEREVLAQVGALLKSNLAAGPLPDLHVDAVVLGGYSNTGAVVRDYIANQHAAARLPDGAPAYDGYFPAQTAVGSAPTAIGDIDVPVLEIQGEREIIETFRRGADRLGFRRPDSDSYRLYEVAGMSHITTRPGDGFLPNPYDCVEPIDSLFPNRHIWDNALRNLIEWVHDGITPPRAPRIELAADGRTIRRDQYGNALGGVRTTYLDVPLATYGAANTNAPGTPASGRCDFYGFQVNFTHEQLARLYPTRGRYLLAVSRRLTRLVHDRWYLKRDAKEVRDEAARAAVP